MLSDLKLPTITFKKAEFYTEGRTEPVRAFVNHRMVGFLAGTDAYFQHPNRPVSTHFGIGFYDNGVVKISQYVPLDDTAFGNGNYDPSGTWDDWGYKTTEVNPQTISIEHQDHGSGQGKGVVRADVQEASQKLQALLRYGTLAEWKAAGIRLRDWDTNGPILIREIAKIPVDGHHIIDHHNIAGKLKPTCWRPWEKDTIGFPRANYVAGIKTWGAILKQQPVPVPPPVPDTPIFTQKQYDEAIAAAAAAAKVAAEATWAAEKADYINQLQLVKNDVKSKAIAYIQSL